jgi:hypothetical protein
MFIASELEGNKPRRGDMKQHAAPTELISFSKISYYKHVGPTDLRFAFTRLWALVQTNLLRIVTGADCKFSSPCFLTRKAAQKVGAP